MAAPSVIASNVAASHGAQQKRKSLFEDSMAAESEFRRPSLLTIDELQTSKMQNEHDEFVCIIGCVLGTIVILASLIGVLILLSRESPSGTATTVPELTSGSGGSGVDKTTIILPGKSARPGRSTASSMTVSETEDTEPTESVVTHTTRKHTTTEEPQDIRGPLLCTVSVHFTESSTLPEDGQCDIIFYESFYVKNNLSGWQDSGLDHFLDLGRNMSRTSIGASFSPVGGQLFADIATGVLLDGVAYLRRFGVKHFGIMNVYGEFATDEKEFAKCLAVLKRIVDHIKRQPNTPVVRTALGVHFSSDYRLLSLEKLKAFRPTYYIAITHMSIPGGTDSNCWVFPMSMMNSTVDFRDKKFENGPTSIVKALDILTWMKNNIPVNMLIYISFSMRAHQYALENISSNVEASFNLFNPCVETPDAQNHRPIHPKQVCSEEYEKYYRHHPEVDAEYTFDPVDNYTLAFDSEKGLKGKVCGAKAMYSNLKFSVAVYDVDFDQEDTTCLAFYMGRGSFRRVKAISAMIPEPSHSYFYDSTLHECLAREYIRLGNPCCPGSRIR